MSNDNHKFDIYDRAFKFAVRAVNFLDKLPRTTAVMEYGRQLIKSSGGIGGNIEEADGALTRKDFINKMGIARRETRESRHWLKLIEAVTNIKESIDKEELKWLINESTEILLILSSIIKNTENKD